MEILLEIRFFFGKNCIRMSFKTTKYSLFSDLLIWIIRKLSDSVNFIEFHSYISEKGALIAGLKQQCFISISKTPGALITRNTVYVKGASFSNSSRLLFVSGTSELQWCIGTKLILISLRSYGWKLFYHPSSHPSNTFSSLPIFWLFTMSPETKELNRWDVVIILPPRPASKFRVEPEA